MRPLYPQIRRNDPERHVRSGYNFQKYGYAPLPFTVATDNENTLGDKAEFSRLYLHIDLFPKEN